MESDLIKTISNLRVFVGYLGEKDQFNWWLSSFFSPSSDAFMQPLFPRTQLLAQVTGVTQAAALQHDKFIGIGHVYHLFRLPEDLEQQLHQYFQDSTLLMEIPKKIDKAVAFHVLEEMAIKYDDETAGPVRVGAISALYQDQSWQSVAGMYLAAFKQNVKRYLYFSEDL